MYYPIMLDLEGKNILIVGGGRVAHRKLKNLLKAGANITVVSQEFIPEFKAIDLNYIEDSYNKKYLKGMFLVLAATSNRQVNLEVAKDAKDLGLLCNIVDNKEESDFISPALVASDNILLAISTNGRYPALSKLIKRDLEARYKAYDDEYMDLLEKLRIEILKNHSSRKEELINSALDLNIKELREFYNRLIKDF